MGTPTANTSRSIYNEARRYLGCVWQQSTDLDPKPLVDADFNDAEMQKIMQVRRAIDAAFGNAARNYNAFRVAEYTAAPTNDFLIGGGDGSAEGAGRFWLGGLNLLNVGAIRFNSNVTGTAASPGVATQIHPRATLIQDWVLSDSSANFEVNMLAGRLLTPSIGYPGSAPYTCPAYTIVSNTATTITVSNIDPSTGLPTMAPMTTYDLGSGLNYYRVELSTPSGGDRTDFVLLDAYLDEVDAVEDPVLNHNQGPAGAASTVESARRHQVSQRVFVNESEVGMYIPVVPIIGTIAPGVTSIIVSDASKLALLHAAGQLNQIRVGMGRNEELLNVTSVTTGGPERINLAEPTDWRHYDLDPLMPSGYVDGDGNRHYVTLLAALNRLDGNNQITTGMIRDYRERHFGSPAELRDMRLDLEDDAKLAFTAEEAVAARIPYVTLGLGTSGSVGRINVSSAGSVADAFTAAQNLLPDGGVIYVRPGTYTLDSTTKIQITKGDISIVGQSIGDVILEGLDAEVISVEAAGFSLENLTLKPGDSQYGVVFTGAWDRCRFSKVTFDGNAQSDIIVYATTALTNTKFRECKFTGGTKTTQPYVQLDAGSRYLFDSCLFVGAAAQFALVYLKTTATDLWFSGCSLSSGANGLLLNEAASEGIKRVVVDSCIFHGQSTAGIYVAAPLSGGYDYSFDNGIFYSETFAAIQISGGVRVKVNDCIVPASATVGVNISGTAEVGISNLRVYSTPTAVNVADTATVDVDGLRVVGTSTQTAIVTANTCTVKANGGYFSTLLRGIVAGSSTAGIYTGISMTTIDTAAAQLTGNNQTLQDITCEDCGSVVASRQIFSVTGDNCRLHNCQVIDMDAPAAGLGHAFYVAGANTTLSSCLASVGVAGSLCRGYSLFGAGVEMENCQVVGMPGFGLYIDAGATGIYRITNFRDESSGTAAATWPIYIAGGEVSIDGLQCEGSVCGGLRAITGVRINAAHVYAGGAATDLILLGAGEHTISSSWIDGADNVTNLVNSVSSTSLRLSACNLLNANDAAVLLTSVGAAYGTMISDCNFGAGSNYANYFISIDANLVAPKISGCRFYGNSRNVAFAVSSAAVSTAIDACQIYEIDDEAISLTGDYAFVSDCYIEDVSTGLNISSAGALVGTVVQNCSLVNGDAGFILKAKDARVQNCSFLGILGYGLTLQTGTTDVSIDSCVFGSDSGGVATRGGISLTGNLCSIRGCGFYNLDDAGVNKAAIEITGNNCQVVGNYIYNCDTVLGGINITGSRAEVHGNYVYDVNASSAYILISTGSLGSSVTGNHLQGTVYVAATGIGVVGSDGCSVEGNRINGLSSLYGISVVGSDYCHVQGNSVSSCDTGIRINTCNCTAIIGNYVRDSGQYGIYLVSSDDAAVTNNYVYGGAVPYGVYLTNSTRPSVAGNHIYGGSHSIYVNDAACEYCQIDSNYMYNAATYAVYSAGSYPKFANNASYSCPAGSGRQYQLDTASIGTFIGNTVIQTTAAGAGSVNNTGAVSWANWKPDDTGAPATDLTNHNRVLQFDNF